MCEGEGGNNSCWWPSSQQKERLLEVRRERELEDHEEANMVQLTLYTHSPCTCTPLIVTPPHPPTPHTHTSYTFRVITSGSTPLVTL